MGRLGPCCFSLAPRRGQIEVSFPSSMIHGHSPPQIHKVQEGNGRGLSNPTFLLRAHKGVFFDLPSFSGEPELCPPPGRPPPAPGALPFPFFQCSSYSAPSSRGPLPLDLQPVTSVASEMPLMRPVGLLPPRQRPGLAMLAAMGPGCEVPYEHSSQHWLWTVPSLADCFCCPGFSSGSWQHRGRGQALV